MPSKVYHIHDNGGRPFKVRIDGMKVEIYALDASEYPDSEEYTVPVKNFTAKKIWVGKSSGKTRSCDHTAAQAPMFDGNSILFQLDGHKYIHVGWKIHEFQIPDEVDTFYSPVGNNDVPYPIILGTENVYFMLDYKFIPRYLFPKDAGEWEDAYGAYYGHVKGVPPLDKQAKKMKGVKMIHDRVF